MHNACVKCVDRAEGEAKEQQAQDRHGIACAVVAIHGFIHCRGYNKNPVAGLPNRVDESTVVTGTFLMGPIWIGPALPASPLPISSHQQSAHVTFFAWSRINQARKIQRWGERRVSCSGEFQTNWFR